MSWISDLAGRAENILNKIDQNAATVLQQPPKSENGKSENDEVKIEESLASGIKKNLSSSSLSLTRALTPKRNVRSELNAKHEEGSVKSERLTGSNLSSRRSSFSSRADGTVVEQEVPQTDTIIKLSTTKPADFCAERELAAIKIVLAEITSERNELQNEVYSLQEQIKQASNESKLKELEELVTALVAERDDMSNERDQLKLNADQYVHSISELESNLSKVRQNLIELTEKLDLQTRETQQKTIELQEYRKKAQTTLQMKEKVIEELKLKGTNFQETNDTGNEKILNMEITGLRQENSHLQEELRNISQQLESSKDFIQKLEKQIEQKTTELSTTQNQLKEKIKIEQERSQQVESENHNLNQEMIAVREEMDRQRKSFSARLHEKESELMKLRSQASEMSGYTDSNSLENRMQSLTQALVKKQAAIETVTAERNALRLQLEKVEDQLRHVMIQQRQQRTQVINVNDTDDAKAQLPTLMRENPFDTNVARRVKRAYTSLDSAGIRLGVFLRRYPLIRIMVFIYVAFLHLWVMFVLLSSTPN